MAPSITRSLSSVTFLLYILPSVDSRHVHNRPLHKHHVRQLVVPAVTTIEEPSQTTDASSSFTAGNAAIADIQAIQEGLSDLPKDLLTFVQAIEHRMEEMEALLQSLINGSSGIASTSRSQPVPFQTTSTGTLPTPGFTGLSIPLTATFETILGDATATSSSSPYTTSQSFMTTRTSRITRTRTITPTSVATASGYLLPNATANSSQPNPVYPYASGSGFPIYPTSSSYTFDPQATGNIAITSYNGGRSWTQGGLPTVCQREEIDIVLLYLFTTFQGPGGYPSFSTSGCNWDLPNANRTRTPGFGNCEKLSEDVTKCQQAGKKVLANFHHYEPESLPSDDRAAELANVTWNLFGGGDVDNTLRPLGPGIKLDGFVMTGEKNSTEWLVFTSTLRGHFEEDQSKRYYLASAPDCSIGDPSVGIGIMAQSDFVWPQFTASGCKLYGLDTTTPPEDGNSSSLDVSNFVNNTFKRWSELLIGQSVLGQPPRLYIGMNLPYNQYYPRDTMVLLFNKIRESKIGNFGGAMIAYGDAMINNVDGRGNNYLYSLKKALDCGSEQCWPGVG